MPNNDDDDDDVYRPTDGCVLKAPRSGR